MIADRPQLPPFPATTPTTAPGAEASQPLDLVFIEGFTGQTVIGIHDSELHKPQTIRIDLTAGVPRPRACDTDSIGDTIDYGEVRLRLHRLLAEHRLQLLESFAETIADILIGEFGAHWVRVVVTKPRKFDDVEGVGVAIERRRPEGGRAAPVLSLIGAGMVVPARR